MSEFAVTIESFENLSKDEQDGASNNGCGKEYATYVRIQRNGDTVLLESDACEPEDKTFRRDLSWVAKWLSKAYEFGKADSI